MLLVVLVGVLELVPGKGAAHSTEEAVVHLVACEGTGCSAGQSTHQPFVLSGLLRLVVGGRLARVGRLAMLLLDLGRVALGSRRRVLGVRRVRRVLGLPRWLVLAMLLRWLRIVRLGRGAVIAVPGGWVLASRGRAAGIMGLRRPVGRARRHGRRAVRRRRVHGRASTRRIRSAALGRMGRVTPPLVLVLVRVLARLPVRIAGRRTGRRIPHVVRMVVNGLQNHGGLRRRGGGGWLI